MPDDLAYPVGKKIEAVRVGVREVVIYLEDGGQLIIEPWKTPGGKGNSNAPPPYLTARLV